MIRVFPSETASANIQTLINLYVGVKEFKTRNDAYDFLAKKHFTDYEITHEIDYVPVPE